MAVSLTQKIVISAIAAIVFLIIAAPFTYGLTNKIGLKTEKADGCPSTQGLIIHTIVFFLVVFLIMMIPMGNK